MQEKYLESESEQLIGGLGIAVGTASLLFLGSLSSSTHPNVDLRIQYSFDCLNLLEEQDYRDYFKQLICNFCIVFFQYKNIPFETIGVTEDMDEAFSLILDKFDQLHASCNSL